MSLEHLGRLLATMAADEGLLRTESSNLSKLGICRSMNASTTISM